MASVCLWAYEAWLWYGLSETFGWGLAPIDVIAAVTTLAVTPVLLAVAAAAFFLENRRLSWKLLSLAWLAATWWLFVPWLWI